MKRERVDGRHCSRWGALTLAMLMMMTACATGTPLRGDAWEREADISDEATDEEELLVSTLPTDFQPVRISESDLATALTALWLHIPLRISTSQSRLYVGRPLALASAPGRGSERQAELARSYGRFCEQRGTPGDCLTLLDDGPRLQADDKRDLALALAVGPALEGVDAEMRAMVHPTRVLATLSFTLTAYMALLIAPEPVSKGAALAFSVLMWGYLGWEFFDLLRAYSQLHEDAPRAATFAQLREVGERFGRVIGPNSVRILVMVATAAVGETAALLSKGSTMPGIGQASRAVELNTGLSLSGAASGAERLIVSVNEGTLRIVLPINAVSMTARDGGGERRVFKSDEASAGGNSLSGGHRAFRSFRAFKRFMGKAGEGKQWHHLVEQHGFNLKRFGSEALHSTENVIPLGKSLHARVSAFYSEKNIDITGSTNMTVREWIRTQSYDAQLSFGMLVIKNLGGGE